jgi:peptide/nickel transport system ATP-binding protein
VKPCTRYYLVAVKTTGCRPTSTSGSIRRAGRRLHAAPRSARRADARRRCSRFQNLRVEFPGRRGRLVAIDDVSFSIAPGEILGVVGESGAGKSLTGAAIIGLIDPPGRISGGEIRLDGRRIDDLPYEQMRKSPRPLDRRDLPGPAHSLDPLYTVGQQLIETIQTHLPMSSADARRRAVRLLQETGIPAAEERLDQYPHQFSAECASASSSRWRSPASPS